MEYFIFWSLTLLFQLGWRSKKCHIITNRPRSHVCKPCADLTDRLRTNQSRRAAKLLSGQNPQEIKSKVPLSQMHPEDIIAKYKNQKKQSKVIKLANNRNEKKIITLLGDDGNDMDTVLHTLAEKEAPALKTFFEKEGGGVEIEKAWRRDLEDVDKRHQRKIKAQRKDFFKDQLKNTNGNKGNRYSPITLRVALAIYSASPAAYRALRAFNIIALPEKKTLQSITNYYSIECGGTACVPYLQRMAEKYQEKVDNWGKEHQDRPKPQWDGTMVIDEAQCTEKITWHSGTHKISGMSMSVDDLQNLTDLYRSINSSDESSSTRILQVLWLDRTSGMDIPGPFYPSPSGMSHTQIVACIRDAIETFHFVGFTTSLVILDGAQSNLTAIKELCFEDPGRFTSSINQDGSISHEINPSIINPFMPDRRIFFTICHVHQLKNMINALFASQLGITIFSF